MFLRACFENPNRIDDVFWDASEALAMRQAIDRERLRLEGIALTEARRIRAATKSCMTCTKPLRYGVDLSIPPQYCSAGCVPAPPPQPSRLWVGDLAPS